MKSKVHIHISLILLACGIINSPAIDRFVALDGGHVPPFTSWADAATNIQAAIDAASAGDTVWVTNGVYSAGGKVMAGDLTNRVAIDKPIVVQSVNGPWFTVIRGLGATNGPTAVRCAWITNGATLQGFMLTAGATRTSGDTTNLASGGAALCLGPNAMIFNCLVLSNSAAALGGGVFQGTIVNSAIVGNRGTGAGGGVAYSALLNCTVVSNYTSSATYQSRHTNCIVYYNGGNYSGGTFSYSCTTPLPAGAGNINSAPLFHSDQLHLTSNSLCRGAGTNLAVGTDLDGQMWSNPPSMGCDEWVPQPAIIVQPRIRLTGNPTGFRVAVEVSGQEPFTCYWTRNGSLISDDGHFTSSQTTNLVAIGLSELDVGRYQVVVSNTAGVAMSEPVELLYHYVNSSNNSPIPPYTSWSTAATNIQDAIDAANNGHVILVTNGVYATGGKVMAGDLTNRVAIDRAIMVRSVNGPWFTAILGAGDTNGPAAVRGVWVGDGAYLTGFTISAGATRTSGDPATLLTGGGIWCGSTNATVANCVIKSNISSSYGGAMFQGVLRNSYVIGNRGNAAVVNAMLINCTVVSNSVTGVSKLSTGEAMVTNSIVYYNAPNYSGGTFAFSCSTPLPAGGGNISGDPKFQSDGVGLSSSSPCRGAGVNVDGGEDIFGRPWLNPPSIGCAEWLPTPSFEIEPWLNLTNFPGGFNISFKPGGQEPFNYFWFHDGESLADDNRVNGTTTTNLIVKKLQAADVGGYWVVVSNSFGIATSQVARVTAHFVDVAGDSPISPYTSWATAATNIQDAIDAAQPGEFVLATNGVYANGGKIKSGDLLNRAAIDKPITVISVNGYRNTIIEGAWDPVSTNGPLAVRGVWMTNGAILAGFTVRNGATRGGNSLTFDEHCGGGIWATSTMPTVLNCLLTNNAARWIGGGAYRGTLRNCLLAGNTTDAGGNGGGGGAGYADLRNCTVSGNRSATLSSGGGTYYGTVRNSIVLQNSSGFSLFNVDNYKSISVDFAYSCSAPLPAGTGNINATPVFLDEGFHLPAQSPCRGSGSASFASGEDMDGEAWANPPSMGADEVIEANLVGPILLTLNSTGTNTLPGLYHSLFFSDSISGRISRIDWDFGDGVVVTNAAYYANHWWTNPGDYTITSTAFNSDHPSGISESVVVHVLPLIQPILQNTSLAVNGFKFTFEAQEEGFYVIQYSTNLVAPVTWQTLQNIPFTPGGTLTITDPVPTNAARFYRVLAQ